MDSLNNIIDKNMISETNNLIILFSIILFMGFLGGVVSWIFRNETINTDTPPNNSQKNQQIIQIYKKFSFWNTVCVSLAGAFILPLFLSLGSNGLMEECRTHYYKYFVFAGFCLLGGVYARDFLNNMGRTLVRKVDDLDKKIDAKVQEAELDKDEMQKNSSKKIIDSEQVLRSKIDTNFELLKETLYNKQSDPKKGDMHSHYDKDTSLTFTSEKDQIKKIDKKIEESAPLRILRKAPKNDPQKNQWGGDPKRNERVITASVEKLQKYWYRINVEVKSTNPNNILKGPVFLFVHDSFNYKDNRIIIQTDSDGVAREELRAYGAFTIGAVCDNGDTWLELDLFLLQNVDREFLEN